MTASHSAKSQAFDASGRLLVYAPPILAGFHGAPLMLSGGKASRRPKQGQRRNWAKRRAYGG